MLKNLAYFLFEETLWLLGLMPTTRRRITNEYYALHGHSYSGMASIAHDYPSKHGAS